MSDKKIGQGQFNPPTKINAGTAVSFIVDINVHINVHINIDDDEKKFIG